MASTDMISPTEHSVPSTPSTSPTSTPKLSATPSTPAVIPTSPTSQLQSTPAESSSPGLLEVLGRGHRTKKPSVLLKQYTTHAASATNPSHVCSPE